MNVTSSQNPPTGTSLLQTSGLSPRSIIQLHVTERCNKACTHCYQDATLTHNDEMSFDQLSSLMTSYEEVCRSRGWKGQVTFAGGEPFVRADFMPLLHAMRRWPTLQFAILTNGSFIDEDVAVQLGALKPLFVQISMEGGAQTHDRIRGHGDFQRCLRVLALLVRTGVKAIVSFTAHRDNYRDFPIIADHVRQTGARSLWADRLVPMGRGSRLATLSPVEARDFFELMDQERAKNTSSQTQIHMHRSLQFLCGGDRYYQCTAGKRLLAVLPNGIVYPCRRLPISLGNVLSTPLDQFFESAKSTWDTPPSCRQCQHLAKCNGGAKCIAYAVHGTLLVADPGCWLAH